MTCPPADARAVLVGAQAGAKVPLPPADVSEKTITADGQPLGASAVTVGDRDSLGQWRVKTDDCVEEILGKLR